VPESEAELPVISQQIAAKVARRMISGIAEIPSTLAITGGDEEAGSSASQALVPTHTVIGNELVEFAPLDIDDAAPSGREVKLLASELGDLEEGTAEFEEKALEYERALTFWCPK
jgi:hypothetical protein